MADKSVKRLGRLLIDFDYITEEQLSKAIEQQEEQDKRLGELLVDLGYISEKDLIQALEFQLGFPHVELAERRLEPHLSRYIPERVARRHRAVPLEKKGDTLRVAMADPSDLVAIEDIEMHAELEVEPLIASPAEIKEALNQFYSVVDEDTQDIFDSLQEGEQTQEPEPDELRQMVEDAPIVKLTNLIINRGIQMKASDIHIEPQEENVRIRYRVDGVLREEMTVPKHSQAALVSRLKILADLDITIRRRPQDGRVQMKVRDMKIDMRVSTLPIIHGEKVVIRLLNQDQDLLQMERLGFTGDNLHRFKSLVEKPHGILLATGPTGSGKSTTLFAALNHLKTPEKNIVTIEDPVEYQLQGINQVQASDRTGLSFAGTLRSILRQDPDIIMVGEIRDKETARIAVRAALTGHLVLSTLHTNDAVSSITRLLDMGIPSYLVASTVIGVIAQRLVRRLCKSCKQEYYPEPEIREFLDIDDQTPLYKPQEAGCERCTGGYRGRLAIQEVLQIDDRIEDMINQGAGEQEIKRYARQQGMKNLFEDARSKTIQGQTSYQELIRVIV